MRLTVRTLLAWIDDVLGAADRGELAGKVAASPVAPQLIERIRGIVENPSLSAPAPAAPGLADDPNTAAEFLDNVLDGERLEAFERVCIESDLHLADVAGSHRILAELLRTPDSLEPFAPAAGRAALEAARTRGSTPRIDTSRGRTGRVPGTVVAAATSRRRAPWFAWLSAAVALLLLVGLGAVLLKLTTGKPARPRQVAALREGKPREESPAPPAKVEEPPAVPVAPAPAAVAKDAAASTAVPEVKPGPQAASDPVEPVAPAAEPGRDAAMIEPPPPVVVPPDVPRAADQPTAAATGTVASRPQDAPPADRTVPFGDALAIGGGAAAARPAAGGTALGGTMRESAASGTNAAADATAANLVEGTLLARVAGGDAAWRSVTAGAAVDVAERIELLVPAGIYPAVVIDGVAIRLHPGTRAVVSRAAEGTPVLELAHGRAVIEADGGGAWPAVIAGGLRGALGLAVRQAAGVEVAFDARTDGGRLDGVPARAAVYSGGAARAWRQAAADGTSHPLIGIPDEVLMPAETALRWDGRDPATAGIEPCLTPEWMSATGPVDRTSHRASADLVRALAAAPPESAVDTLRRRSAAGLPEDRAVAAATLAFLGEPAGLVDLLCDEPPRGLNESQWSAVEASVVPVILARGGREADTLLAAFRDHGPDGAAIAALASGVDDDDLAADGGVRLVEGLDAGAIAVRRYSIRRLREIVPLAVRRSGDGFRGDHDAAARRAAVAWWRSLAEKGGIQRQPIPAADPRAGRDGE